ncbi:hypothetical protein [Pseudomonas sp. EA_5y_Pfl2_R50]|uniref:hypothetical protein n=1 Tax=Pseudomonas sp. EA_5y_Pfl2_R50 TaxID=3088691 RepID=UPI0030DCF464
MRDNDTNFQQPSDDHAIATGHEIEAMEYPAEPVVATRASSAQPACANTTKPHRNTGSLDSLGGGRLP